MPPGLSAERQQGLLQEIDVRGPLSMKVLDSLALGLQTEGSASGMTDSERLGADAVVNSVDEAVRRIHRIVAPDEAAEAQQAEFARPRRGARCGSAHERPSG
jgi:hypothetical protein